MTMKQKVDGLRNPGFPLPHVVSANRETPPPSSTDLRDWFAGQALQLAAHTEWFSQSPEHVAQRAYRLADAMLEARRNPTGANQGVTQ